MSAQPEMPADTPLLTVLRRLEGEGFTGQFQPIEDAAIRCLTCREPFPAAGVHADQVTRLEGTSDPADMLMVTPLRCPRCGTAGVLVTSYGPDATAEEAQVQLALDRAHPQEGSGGGLPGTA